MYKNLSSYADIANAIKPDIDQNYDAQYKISIVPPTDSDLNAFINASKKLDFRARVESGTTNPYDINFSFDIDTVDDDGNDGFDNFLAGKYNGREYNVPTQQDGDTIDMVNAIAEFDPEKQDHSDWLNSVSNEYKDRLIKNNEKRIAERSSNLPQKNQNKDNEVDEFITKNQLSDRVRGKMVDVVSAMKSNKKFGEKIAGEIPDGYINRAIDEFTNRTLSNDDRELRNMISENLRNDLKSSRGDIEQLYSIYST